MSLEFALTDPHVGTYRGDELVRLPLTSAPDDVWPAALYGSLHLATDRGAPAHGLTPGPVCLDPWIIEISSKLGLLAQYRQAYWLHSLDEGRTLLRFEKDGAQLEVSWAEAAVQAPFVELLDAVERFLTSFHDLMTANHPVLYRRWYRRTLSAFFDIETTGPEAAFEPDLRRLRDMPVTWRGDLWTRDVPTVLSPENMAKVREALSRGFVCGYHGIFCGGCSPTYWVATNAADLEKELATSRPGDAYEIWAATDLEESGLLLAHDKGRGPLLDAAAIKRVEDFLGVEYNEVMAVTLSASGASLIVRDRDDWDEVASQFEMVTAEPRELFIFNFTAIDTAPPLVRAKYPDERGFVPVGGAY